MQIQVTQTVKEPGFIGKQTALLVEEGADKRWIKVLWALSEFRNQKYIVCSSQNRKMGRKIPEDTIKSYVICLI